MAQIQNNPVTMSYFIQKHSVYIRIWHWLTFLAISGSMITVLINSTLTNQRENIPMVQEQLMSKDVAVNEEQAFAVTREYEDKFWGVHKLFGYSIAFLLLSRIIFELTVSGDEKISSRIKNALGLYKKNDKSKPEYRHYLAVKSGYLAFYILLLSMALTGLGLAFGRNFGFSRELHNNIKEIHSIGQYFIYGFVLVHLSGVIIAETRKSGGIVSGMINGNR